VVNTEEVRGAFVFYQHVTFVGGHTQPGKTDTVVAQVTFHFDRFLYLDDNTRIFGKQQADQVSTGQAIQVDFQTTLRIGETHFQQGSDQTTG